MFVLSQVAKEIKPIRRDEETWWNTRLIKAENDLHDRYRLFVENFNKMNDDENFAYEGIFDQKQKVTLGV